MSSNEQTNCISRSTVIANVIIKKSDNETYGKRGEKNKNKWISMKVYLVETVQHRVCVCARARVSSRSEKVEALQSFLSFFTHKVQLPTGVQLFFFFFFNSWKGHGDPSPSPTPSPFSSFQKNPTSDSQLLL